MFTRIESTPKPYDWGSPTTIPRLLGREPDGRPQAELWLGAHPAGRTCFIDPPAGLPATLNEWADEHAPHGRLPFLLKLLAAEHPLSLQAHPTLEHARAAYRDEENRGVPIGSPDRNYSDPWHKPELIVALEDGFDALCGFRDLERSLAFLRSLALAHPTASALAVLHDDLAHHGLADTVAAVLTEPDAELIGAVAAAAQRCTDAEWAAELTILRILAERHPGDPGIVIAALMNAVTLCEGGALYLPAGNIHAYVRGFGIEIMASSDNVLRGGLTSKRVDVPELLRVLDATGTTAPLVAPVARAGGYDEYPVPVPDFRLLRVLDGRRASIPVDAPAIAVVTRNSATLRQGGRELALRQGEAAFLTPDDGPLEITTDGSVFVGCGVASE